MEGLDSGYGRDAAGKRAYRYSESQMTDCSDPEVINDNLATKCNALLTAVDALKF